MKQDNMFAYLFFLSRCVRLGENPISDIARKQICEGRTVSEREYKVTVSWNILFQKIFLLSPRRVYWFELLPSPLEIPV